MSAVIVHLACRAFVRASLRASRARRSSLRADAWAVRPVAPGLSRGTSNPVQRSYRWVVGSASVTFSHYRCDVITFVGNIVIDVVIAVV